HGARAAAARKNNGFELTLKATPSSAPIFAGSNLISADSLPRGNACIRSAACAARCSALSPAKEERNTVMAWFQTTSGASFRAATLDVSVAAFGGSPAIALERTPEATKATAITAHQWPSERNKHSRPGPNRSVF